MYFVIRNSKQFGPYTKEALKSYVEDGKILFHDKAFSQFNQSLITTVGQHLKNEGISVRIKHKGSIYSQIKDIGRELIIPNDILSRHELFKDKKLLILALVGISPAFLIHFTLHSFFTFYCIALYFSSIWGLFFYFLFKTDQVKAKTAIYVFFLSQVFVFILYDILLLPNWPVINFFYSLIDNQLWFLKLTGFIFGVGICEETVKAIPLFLILYKAKEPIIPQTMVFYGLISGIAFGVFEGVQYQTTVNTKLDYNNAFFMNISRLTSLPFLHSIWSGISGYFIAFAALYPKYRRSLFCLAIMIPAFIHGLYDTMSGSILGLILTIVGVILLMSYLRQSVNYQSKLSK